MTLSLTRSSKLRLNQTQPEEPKPGRQRRVSPPVDQVPVPRNVDPVEVTSTLAQSKAAHVAYRQAVKRGDVEGRRTHLVKAAQLRRDAHALDPLHTARCWTEEQRDTATGRDTHAELSDFYRKALAR